MALELVVQQVVNKRQEVEQGVFPFFFLNSECRWVVRTKASHTEVNEHEQKVRLRMTWLFMT